MAVAPLDPWSDFDRDLGLVIVEGVAFRDPWD
jgi:hypothetical protein